MDSKPISAVVVILLLSGVIFISGCTTLFGSWSSVTSQNTRAGYERFISEYPDSELAKEARKRIEDPDYTFLTTCRIGTPNALEGYLVSYPSSDYAPMVSAYAEFLKETTPGSLKLYKQFVAQHPNHLFVTEAKIATPLLWLKETGQKVGVIVNIKKLIFKGILGGGQGDAEKVRQKVYQRFKTALEQEGVQPVLLDNLDSGKATEERTEVVIIADYSELESPKSSPQMSGTYSSPLVNALSWSAADSLANIIWKPAQEVISVRVMGVNNGVEYYSGFSGLSSSTVGRINRPEALKAIGKSPTPADIMVDLKGRDLSDPEVSKESEELLKQLKSAFEMKKK